MARGVVDQVAVEALGKFNSSIISVELAAGEILGAVASFPQANVDYAVVEVLGKFTFQVGLTSAELVRGEVIGREATFVKANVEKISAEVIGQWAGF